MHRRSLTLALAASPALLLPHAVRAQGLAALSNADAAQGVKAALEAGALAAVRILGVQDGFLANPKVHIPLPSALQDAAKLLKAIGRKAQVEELEVAINRAAEAAVPLAKNLLVNAVRTMSVTDAKQILTGGDTSVTTFFADRTRTPLSAEFLPVVKKATSRVDLAAKYDRVAGKAAGLGLVNKEDASIDHYVTRKALDGLYLVIGEEEKKLRSNPMEAVREILRKVFGAIR
ncbi:MAG: DUF4197 domain-containing protein [Comamonadaceae bacterium]|nr:MAG: DUF4197 domain-containing protein [Comamonadaceae bacterium]